MVRGRIVLVPFPFDDLSSVKLRPALCLTEPIGQHRHVIVAFVTSRVPTDGLSTDVVLDSADPQFAQTGLKVTSAIRLHRLMTMSADAFRRELGHVPDAIWRQVRVQLAKVFDLDVPGPDPEPAPPADAGDDLPAAGRAEYTG